eukprot:gene4778-6702_t
MSMSESSPELNVGDDITTEIAVDGNHENNKIDQITNKEDNSLPVELDTITALGLDASQIGDEGEVWEVKAVKEKEEKIIDIKENLLQLGLQDDEVSKFVAEDVPEAWEVKVDKATEVRKSEYQQKLQELGFSEEEASLACVENLDAESWERKVEYEKPLDEAFIKNNKDKRQSWITNLTSFFKRKSVQLEGKPDNIVETNTTQS